MLFPVPAADAGVDDLFPATPVLLLSLELASLLCSQHVHTTTHPSHPLFHPSRQKSKTSLLPSNRARARRCGPDVAGACPDSGSRASVEINANLRLHQCTAPASREALPPRSTAATAADCQSTTIRCLSLPTYPTRPTLTLCLHNCHSNHLHHHRAPYTRRMQQ